MSKRSSFFPTETPQNKPILPISSRGRYFFGQKTTQVALMLSLTACGGGGSGSTSTTGGTQTVPVVPTNPITPTPPISSIPLSSTAIVELGPISGGSVQFKTLNGTLLSNGGTKSDGSLDYSPRDIVSRMGNEQWLIVQVSGGMDIDANDDGIIDTNPTPIAGFFRMLVPRSSLERGERIVVNPRAGLVSETFLSRYGSSLSQSTLDSIARQTGATDQNNDGIINYGDLISIQMKNVEGVSKIVPVTSGYISAIHLGDTNAKANALINVARTENHIIASIIPSDSNDDHTPSLRLQTPSSNSTILYTLDLSSPIPGGSGTRSVVGGITIPFQNGKIYYREQFSLNGVSTLGKVEGFDLTSDWTELAQKNANYNANGRENTVTEVGNYKNTSYKILTTSNKITEGYTYPKLIDCQVGNTTTTGCHFGPYMAWSPEHENRVRSLIDQAIKRFIDSLNSTPINPTPTPTPTIPPTTTPTVPVTPTPTNPPNPTQTIPNNPAPNLIDIIRDSISYKNGFYNIRNIWTLSLKPILEYFLLQ